MAPYILRNLHQRISMPVDPKLISSIPLDDMGQRLNRPPAQRGSGRSAATQPLERASQCVARPSRPPRGGVRRKGQLHTGPVCLRTAASRSRTSPPFPAAINWRSSRYCSRASRRTRSPRPSSALASIGSDATAPDLRPCEAGARTAMRAARSGCVRKPIAAR